MEYTALGRTGLKVSVAGLGCGGPSRLGLRDHSASQDRAIALVRQALDAGVNFLDTAQSYGTEAVVGKALAGVPRHQVIISTKKTLPAPGDPRSAEDVRQGLEQSLKLLGTDYIDIYHLHGLEPGEYEFATSQLMPAMVKLRDQGKIRFIGVTEAFVEDPSHRMLQRGVKEDLWDVVMVGFNMLNPSARKAVLPLTQQRGTGVLNMFAVRRALSQPERLKGIVADLVRTGKVDARAVNPDDPLDFVRHDSDAKNLPEAAYRFCRHEPGIHVVLTGTGNPKHLRENLDALVKPPLPQPVLERLDQLFGQLDHLTAN
jgi:L-galactose dehydrogenase